MSDSVRIVNIPITDLLGIHYKHGIPVSIVPQLINLKGFPAYVRSQCQAFLRETLEGDFDNAFFFFAENKVFTMALFTEDTCLVIGIASGAGQDLLVFQFLTTTNIFDIKWLDLAQFSERCGVSEYMASLQRESLMELVNDQVTQLESKVESLQHALTELEEIKGIVRLLDELPTNSQAVPPILPPSEKQATESNQEPPVSKCTIPVYYNSQYLDDWVPPLLDDLAHSLRPFKFELIEQLPTQKQKVGIYLYHVVTDRTEEYVKKERLNAFLQTFEKGIVIYMRNGLQDSAFEQLEKLTGFALDCLTLYYHDTKLSMTDKPAVKQHLNLLKRFLKN